MSEKPSPNFARPDYGYEELTAQLKEYKADPETFPHDIPSSICIELGPWKLTRALVPRFLESVELYLSFSDDRFTGHLRTLLGIPLKQELESHT